MSRTVQISCAASGIAMPFLLFAGLLSAHFLPPLDPELTADQVAAFYREHSTGIRIGCVLMMFGAGALLPFAALMAAHVRRLEPGSFTPLTWMNVFGGLGLAMAVLVPTFIFAAAAYRTDADPDVVRLANDLAWIPFVMNVPAAVLQAASLGVAVLRDPHARRGIPRWVGYYNLWVAFTFAFGFMVCLFTSGPFAWNGLLAFWFVAVVFGTWFLVMGTIFIRAAPAIELDPDPDPTPDRRAVVAA